MPLAALQFQLKYKAVKIDAFDEHNQKIGNASGFIRQEVDGFYLYTCWHVVTKLNPYSLRFKDIPKVRSLRISIQKTVTESPEISCIGGLYEFTLPLYDSIGGQNYPVWYQDPQHEPNADLNAIHIRVPNRFDAVKIKIPDHVNLYDFQYVDKEDFVKGTLNPGDKVYVVGYPYGYSALGSSNPTPIVLTRFVAATRLENRFDDFLLDGAGAPAMSGGPVFVERSNQLQFIGLYTGLIYPDSAPGVLDCDLEERTVLGTCCDLRLSFYAIEFTKSTKIPSITNVD